MSKYIVTGGCGFIGSHIVEELLALDYEVVVVDDLSTGFESYLPKHSKLTFLNLDISDWNALSRNFAYFKNAKGVFHLAAVARIQPSIFNPTLTHDTNITGTFNILEMMRMCNISSIVFSASSSYYGKKVTSECRETDTHNCQTPYAISKYMGELYCETWGTLHGIKSARLRYFNVYGPRSPLEGQYAPVIGLFFRQAFSSQPMTVVGDGKQRRDFTHVSDVVNANLLAMWRLNDEPEGTNWTLNIGTGTNYTILEVAEMIKQSLKKINIHDATHVHVPERIGEAMFSLASNDLAKKIICWQPNKTLQEGIDDLRDYYYLKKLFIKEKQNGY